MQAPATVLPWIAAIALVVGAALAAGLGPIPLIAAMTYGPQPRRGYLEPSGAALTAGLATLALGAVLGWKLGTGLGAAAACLAAMAMIDLRLLVIPDLHVVMLGALALAGPFFDSWSSSLEGAAIGGGLLFAVRALFRWRSGVEGLGLGDVKLMLALGALCGPVKVLWVIVAGALIGVGLGLARNRGRIAGAGPMPFGALVAAPTLGVLTLIAMQART